MKNYRIYSLVLVCCLAVFSGCKPQKALKLPGVWEESFTTAPEKVNYTVLSMDFKCNEDIYLTYTTHKYAPDTLSPEQHIYQEFIKGNYTVQGDQLFIQGKYYTDETFLLEATPENHPYTTGNFSDTLDYRLTSEYLYLESSKEKNNLRRFIQSFAMDCYD